MTPKLLWTVAALLAGAAAMAAAQTAAEPPMLPDADDGALALPSEPDPPPAGAKPAAASPTKFFVEAAAGHATRRYGLDGRGTNRVSADLRTSSRVGDTGQVALSARVDAVDPKDGRIDDGAIFSLREVYAGWQDESASWLVDGGRINLRHGPGYGYNPTDFLRDNALRTLTTADPFLLRENRLGTFMLRGQKLWSGGSFELALAPELADRRSTRGFSLDLGSTNARRRALAVLGTRWSETLDTRLLLYKESGAPLRFGANGTVLLSNALVAHAELSSSKESDLLSRALGQPGQRRTGQRAAIGLTYTTATQLSITLEYEGNRFALDRDGTNRLAALGPQAWSAYYLQALALQELSGRHAALLYVTQRNLGLKGLDLNVIVRANPGDKSRMAWIDLKYKLDHVDLALQLQDNHGALGSELGSAVNRGMAAVVATFHF